MKEQEKMLIEFEADLLKYESYLKAKEEQLTKKENDVEERIKSGQGLPKKSIESLIIDEYKQCLASWQKRGIP